MTTAVKVWGKIMKIMSNMHTHSTFSDGKNAPRDIIEAAIEKGFCAIGLSDHSYTHFDDSYCLPPTRYGEYRNTVRQLQKEYEGKIKVLLGLEQDAFSEPLVKEDFDYFICGVHYVKANGVYYPIDLSAKATKEAIDVGFGGDQIAFSRAYYEDVVKCVSLKPLFLAHFDLITKHRVPDESDPRYISLALEALDAVMETGTPIEVNTGAMARGVTDWPYPAEFLMRRIAEKNGLVTLGSDCHDCTKLDYAFDVAVDALRRNGVHSVLIFDGEKYVEQGI